MNAADKHLPGPVLCRTAALRLGGIGKPEPAFQLLPARFGNIARDFPCVAVTALVDRRAEHEVHAVGVKLRRDGRRDRIGEGFLSFRHRFRQVAADEHQMGTAARAFTRHGGKMLLRFKPRAHRSTRVGFAVQIDMDERGAHHDPDVVVAAVGKILRKIIRRDLGGGVSTPAFGDWFLAALVFIPAIRRAERMHSPAHVPVIELRRAEPIPRVDVGGDEGAAAILAATFVGAAASFRFAAAIFGAILVTAAATFRRGAATFLRKPAGIESVRQSRIAWPNPADCLPPAHTRL